MKSLSISFYLKESSNPKSKVKTQIWVNVNTKQRTRKSTGLNIEPNNWNFEKGWPKTSFADYAKLEEKLNKIKVDIRLYCECQISEGAEPTPTGLIEFIRSKRTLKEKPKVLDFYDRYEEFLNFKKEAVSELTLKKYKTLFNLLKEFEARTVFPIRFDTINESFEVKFKKYSTEVKGHLNDTVDKHFDILASFMKWGLKHKYHSTVDFQYFSIAKNKSEPISLTLEELKRLLVLDLNNNPKLLRVRDKFCLQCLTGQRFTDINSMAWEDFNKQSTGELFWRVYQDKGKNPDPVDVPILNLMLEILQRQQQSVNSKFVFKEISNDKYNKYIKELCIMAGINDHIIRKKYSGKTLKDFSGPKWKFISSHTARRTFVTIFDELGMSHKAIMAITGHKKFDTLKRYLGTSNNFVNEQFKKSASQILL